MSPESIQSLGHLFSGVFLVRQLLCLLFIPGALDQGDWSACIYSGKQLTTAVPTGAWQEDQGSQWPE